MSIYGISGSPLDHSEAINQIKKLQHSFGYLLENSDWDGAATLFTEDAVLQVGHHEPALGSENIREHLRQAYDLDLHVPEQLVADEVSTKKIELDQVRGHLQIMPVITIAPDALSAQGTWRHLGVGGGPGAVSFWAEGPQEVSYLRDQNRWRISSLRWFRTLVVPYQGGWQEHSDQTARTSTPLDTTGQLSTWPHMQATDFHFLQTQSTYSPADAIREFTDANSSDPAKDSNKAQRISHLESTRTIENVQSMLGYYLDKNQWNKAIRLCHEHATYSRDGHVLVRGHDALHELFRSLGPEGPIPGRLSDFIHTQPIIEVDPAGKTAHGRWKIFAQLAHSGQAHEWGLLEIEVDYERDDACWLIKHLNITNAAFTDYSLGWGLDRRRESHVITSTKSPMNNSAPRDTETTRPKEEAYTAALETRLERLMIAQDVERLQYVYGYYLAELLWDELSDLFAEQGTLEIALRGVYRGRSSIRNSLKLYGSGLEYGVLHNHMQFQPVIHLNEESTTAFIRARALSMMGQYETWSMWMGGVYENQFIQEDGRWRMVLDRVVNTYFAPYKIGWKDLPLRAAPGVSTVIPPDEPPTEDFNMYPAAHLVPYHFDRREKPNA